MTLERKSGHYCEYIYFTAAAADSAVGLTKVNMLDSVNQVSVETH